MPGSPPGCALCARCVAEPRGAGGPMRRQPLDALARRARRDQSHRRGAREDRHRRSEPRSARCSTMPKRRPIPCRTRADRIPWKDPQSGYVRRNISPPNFPSPIRIVEVAFPAGARVSYETGARESAIAQQIWVRDGAIEVTVGTVVHQARQGRLSRHATRCAGDVSQSHAQDRALHRGAGVMSASPFGGSIPSPRANSAGLCEVLIDCVEGGASVNFMHADDARQGRGTSGATSRQGLRARRTRAGGRRR